MKNYYLVKEANEQETLGLYGTKNGALFAIANHAGIADPMRFYGELCRGLGENNVYTLIHGDKEYVVVSYELNRNLWSK